MKANANQIRGAIDAASPDIRLFLLHGPDEAGARELAQRLDGANANPDKLPLDALAADLTNHVIPSAIVTPGAVGTLPELQLAGFTYAK